MSERVGTKMHGDDPFFQPSLLVDGTQGNPACNEARPTCMRSSSASRAALLQVLRALKGMRAA